MSPPVGRLLVGVCGSVGLTSLLPLLGGLRGPLAREVRVIATPDAVRFVSRELLQAAVRADVYVHALDQYGEVRLPHADLPAWADAFVVVPATAATLASAAAGEARTLLTLALLNAPGPVGFVPNMSTAMWAHPAVQRNVSTLRADGQLVLDPGRGATGISLGGGPAGPSLDPYAIRAFILRVHAAAGAGPADGTPPARPPLEQVVR